MKKQTLLISILLIGIVAATALAQNKQDKSDRKKLKPRVVPSLQLETGVIISKADGYKRPNAQSVCAGDKIAFTAKVSNLTGADLLPLKWTISGGHGAVDGLGRYVLDTTGLPPGTYTVTAETSIPYEECEGNCTAFDSKSFAVVPCYTCFVTPNLTLSSATQFINPGEVVSICSTPVSGGYSYGTLVPTWTTTAGKITGDASCAKLDTTSIPNGGTVTVSLKLTGSDIPECEAKGTITFQVTEEIVATAVEMGPCDTFKRDSARVDNVCKANLVETVRRLEADPNARLVIDSYYHKGEKQAMAYERGKNVRDRLADGSIGVSVDANRLIVRPSGLSEDGTQVRMFILPAGSKMPPGAQTVDVGGVTKENRRAPARRR
ncbi:MAG: hypothetical protein JNM09_23540 [Blastocatellia bacterium]|nr:hypothetical protein [Blastocatellia bacterium]